MGKESFFKDIEEELEDLRKMSVHDLRMLRLNAIVEHESGKINSDFAAKVSPLLLMLVTVSVLYWILTDKVIVLIPAAVSFILIVLGGIWLAKKIRNSRKAYRLLILLDEVLREKQEISTVLH